MYGTTMRNYNVNRASKPMDDNSIFSKRIQAKSQKRENMSRDTRYIKMKNETH